MRKVEVNLHSETYRFLFNIPSIPPPFHLTRKKLAQQLKLIAHSISGYCLCITTITKDKVQQSIRPATGVV